MSLRLVEKSLSGEAFLMHVYWMPVFDEVRQLPEFKDLLRNIRLVDLLAHDRLAELLARAISSAPDELPATLPSQGP